MTENLGPDSLPATPATDILDDAAKAAAAAAQPTPRFRMVPADLPSLIAILADFTVAPNRHLDAAFRAAIDAGVPQGNAIRDVSHHAALRDWVLANPDAAARIVQVAVYMANGRFVAQEEVPAAPEAVSGVTPPTSEAQPTAEAASG